MGMMMNTMKSMMSKMMREGGSSASVRTVTNKRPLDDADPAAVEQFIAESDLDERAGEALRNARPKMQQFVLDKGNLKFCRNASSALLGRLRDAQKETLVAQD